ncbi:Pyridoxine/pyridoxamine 5'-phosphate oxidase [Nonlabens sp. Hel1_33_55]|uniref:pyridoxamine 5'-phosphate oxidase family protein n=1 Tax=Nonlabens sp. Hel1_33_55 TaxID=1336802 RepID=UPI000875E83D|nr:pyridoxamine 5'-phosphate oxidase family protein [Nonlabens sp. Hel1_33_55]SCY13761.1 Pyridoxine/pyridoxamine 5'-phosphate oxidase [Nonlabens sp. Hel1_33_55]
MLEDYFQELKHDLRGALSKRNHPFKYGYLTTVDEQLQPRARTVVIREISESMELIIFTDSRTTKVHQLSQNPKASLLFYNSKSLRQIRVDGLLEPITDEMEIKRLFQKVSSKSIKDYTTQLPPGSPIKNPDHVEYVERSENHFLPLRFVSNSIELLQLKRPNHLRALYQRTNEDWKGQWLVP